MTGTEAVPPPCPECAQGKHGNCDGGTWDEVADAPADCPCAKGDHRPTRCSGCYDSFSGPWCDNCDQWPCVCEQEPPLQA